MPRTVLRLSAALSAALVLAPAVALGEDRVLLRWSAPAECPSESDVRAEIDRLLGSSRASPKKPIEVSAKVSKDEHGTWHVRVETPGDGTTRVREIHGATCRAISNAAALIVALMIDPDAVSAAPPAASSSPNVPPQSSASAAPALSGVPSAPPESTSAPGATAPPPIPSAPIPSAPGAPTAPPLSSTALPVSQLGFPFPPPRPSLPPAPPKLPVGFRAGAWAGADAGSLPGVSAGFGILAALLLGAQRIEIGFAVRPPTNSVLAARPTAGGKVDLISGSLGTCRTLLEKPLRLSPCLTFEAGRMHAVGFGVTTPGQAEQPWFALGAGGLLEWSPVPQLAFLLRVGAAVPFARPTFVLEGLGAVYQPSAVAGRAEGGVEIVF